METKYVILALFGLLLLLGYANIAGDITGRITTSDTCEDGEQHCNGYALLECRDWDFDGDLEFRDMGEIKGECSVECTTNADCTFKLDCHNWRCVKARN